MKRTAPTRKFWTILLVCNFVAMLYPIVTLIQSPSDDGAQFFLALIVIVLVFVLGIVDVIAVTLAYALVE